MCESFSCCWVKWLIWNNNQKKSFSSWTADLQCWWKKCFWVFAFRREGEIFFFFVTLRCRSSVSCHERFNFRFEFYGLVKIRRDILSWERFSHSSECSFSLDRSLKLCALDQSASSLLSTNDRHDSEVSFASLSSSRFASSAEASKSNQNSLKIISFSNKRMKTFCANICFSDKSTKWRRVSRLARFQQDHNKSYLMWIWDSSGGGGDSGRDNKYK